MRGIHGILLKLALGIFLALTFALPIHAQGKDTIKSIRGRKPPASNSRPKPAPARRSRRTVTTPVRRAAVRTTPPKIDPLKIVVSRLGQGQFKTIGEAVRSAKAGARIVVRPGVYEESVNIDRSVEISVEPGAAEGSTILENVTGSVLIVDSSDCVIRGLS